MTQETLSGTGLPEDLDAKYPDVDFWSLHGEAKTKIKGWRWYAIDGSAVGGTLVTGLVPDVFFKSGPRKGEPNWSKCNKATERRVVITDAEHLAFKLKWQRETGMCLQCYGHGQMWCGWSKETGSLYRPCNVCGATGKAPEVNSP